MSEIYDPNKIGKFIAWGSDHFVYEYEQDKVIKFSLLSTLLGKHAEEKALHDIHEVEMYFGEYALKTHIVLSPNGKHIAKIQPKILGHSLHVRDLETSEIKQQLQAIFGKREVMVRTGKHDLDFAGIKGLFVRELTNVYVTDTNRLVILDALIFDFSQANWFFRFFLNIAARAVIARQNKFFKNAGISM